jgi:hypothetical protein
MKILFLSARHEQSKSTQTGVAPLKSKRSFIKGSQYAAWKKGDESNNVEGAETITDHSQICQRGATLCADSEECYTLAYQFRSWKLKKNLLLSIEEMHSLTLIIS